jgi:pentapeptide MXKDX repeat protein
MSKAILPSPGPGAPTTQETTMTLSARITSAAFALALASSALGLASNAYADDAMKPAATSSDEMTADCKAKAGMESDSMKKDEAMKACDDMGMKDGAMKDGTMKPDTDSMKSGAMKTDTMKPADGAMKPASSN